MKRIDVHAHYLPPAYESLLARHGMVLLDGGFPKPDWSEELQLLTMHDLALEKVHLSVSSPHLHFGDAEEAIDTARGCNEYGAGLIKRYPDKMAVFASLPLPEIDAAVQEIRYCREALSIMHFCMPTNARGIYLGSPVLDPVMEELNRQYTVIALHPGAPSAVPDAVCEDLPLPFMEFFFDTTRAVANLVLHGIVHRYPNIRFIVPHAGAYLPILSDRFASLPNVLPKAKVDEINKTADGLTVMEDLQSLYYDLGGIVVPKQLDVLRKLVDDSHLLYGSDSPFTPGLICQRLAADLDFALGEKAATKVYRENPEKLLKKG